MASNFILSHGSQNFPAQLKGCVLAIGNFDGIHRGHQFLLNKALELGKQNNMPAVVLTFDPHPRQYFGQKNLSRITTNQQKYNILEKMGFSGVVEQKFDQKLQEIGALEFIEQILLSSIEAKFIVTGEDFKFGKDRSGDIQFLRDYAQKSGKFSLLTISAQKNEDIIISSSYIRQLLAKGNVKLAAHLMGYHYNIEQVVVHGAKLGRKLGFPTANMLPGANQLLAEGIYAVKVKRQNGTVLDGVASFGRRPTVVESGAPLLETYIFNFNEEIYGEYLAISFFDYIRPEQKFADVSALVEQMHKDAQDAKTILAQSEILSALDKILCF